MGIFFNERNFIVFCVKIHFALITLAVIMIPFFGFNGFTFLGGMGTNGALYPIFVGLVVWIIQLVLGKQRLLIPNFANMRALWLFLLVCFLSIIVNIYQIYFFHFQGQTGLNRAVITFGSLFCMPVISLYVYNVLAFSKQKDILLWLSRYMVVSFLIAGGYSLFEIGSFFDVGPCHDIILSLDDIFRGEKYRLNYGMRLRSVASEASEFGEYLAVLFPWLIIKVSKQKKYVLVFLYCVVLCLFSLSRTAAVILVLQYILCFIFFERKTRKLIITLFILTITLTGCLYSIASDYFGEKTFDIVLESVTSSEGTSFDTSNITRFESQEAARAMFYDYPLLGIGYGMYGFLAPEYYSHDAYISSEIVERSINIPNGSWPPVHSFIFRILAETGAIGLSLWVLVLFFTIRLILQYRKQADDQHKIYATALIISLIGAFITEWKSDSVYFFYTWLVISISMALREHSR